MAGVFSISGAVLLACAVMKLSCCGARWELELEAGGWRLEAGGWRLEAGGSQSFLRRDEMTSYQLREARSRFLHIFGKHAQQSKKIFGGEGAPKERQKIAREASSS